MEVCRNSLKLFMIVLLNQHYQHLELNKFFSKSDGNYDYNKKRDFKQQNYSGYQKDSSSKYQKESNCYQKDGISCKRR